MRWRVRLNRDDLALVAAFWLQAGEYSANQVLGRDVLSDGYWRSSAQVYVELSAAILETGQLTRHDVSFLEDVLRGLAARSQDAARSLREVRLPPDGCDRVRSVLARCAAGRAAAYLAAAGDLRRWPKVRRLLDDRGCERVSEGGEELLADLARASGDRAPAGLL